MLYNKLYLPILAIIALVLIPTQSRPTKDIIECISKIQLIRIPQNLTSLCDNDLNDKACPKTIAGINQCLLLNDCLDNLKDEVIFVLLRWTSTAGTVGPITPLTAMW